MAYPDFAMSLVGKLTDAAVEALRRLEKIECETIKILSTRVWCHSYVG